MLYRADGGGVLADWIYEDPYGKSVPKVFSPVKLIKSRGTRDRMQNDSSKLVFPLTEQGEREK